MSESKTNLRTSFYIATKDRGYICSDYVVGISEVTSDTTRLDIIRGGDYFASANVDAPLETVAALFEENGYKFIRKDDIAARIKVPAP